MSMICLTVDVKEVLFSCFESQEYKDQHKIKMRNPQKCRLDGNLQRYIFEKTDI